MSIVIVEKRSVAHHVAYVVEDRDMSATTSICLGLVEALAIYILGSAVLLQDVGGGGRGGLCGRRRPAQALAAGVSRRRLEVMFRNDVPRNVT